jgi:uncharacterized protein (DUF1330 family)
MKTPYIVALSLAAGAVLGAGAAQGLRAQTKPPVFQITLQEVTNADALAKEFVPIARGAVRQHGGHPLASGAPIAVEGSTPSNRIVINQWDSIEQLRAWYNSPEYQKARDIGNKYAKFQIIAVEGLAQQ